MTIELLNMDCMDYLRDCEDNAFDLAIVDPPYGINWTKSISYSEKQEIHQNKKGYKSHVNKKWDEQKPSGEYFSELKRVSANRIIWGGNYFSEYLPSSRCWIVWDKMCEDFTAINNELAWTSFDKKIKTFKRPHGMDKGFMSNSYHIHPTQKPVKLYDWLLSNYAKEGDRILDTHLGSGSSAIAAHYGQFDFVGIEIDEDYYKAACERFEKETAQLDLLA